jgi:dCMP deaminase
MILIISGWTWGCKIYTALFPCNECTKAIIQSVLMKLSTCLINMKGLTFLKHLGSCLIKLVKYRKVEAKVTSILLHLMKYA